MLLARFLAAACALFGCVAHAAVFSIPLDFEVVISGDDQWLAAPFDLGVQFNHIDSAVVTVTLSQEFEAYHACSGYSCWTADLLLDVVAPGKTGDPFVPEGQEVYATPGAQSLSDNIWQREIGRTLVFGPLVETLEENEEISLLPSTGSYVWPEGLLEGRGAAVLALEQTNGGTSLNPGAPSVRRLTLPNGQVLSATLTVTGQVVPEPSALATAAALLVAWGLRESKR